MERKRARKRAPAAPAKPASKSRKPRAARKTPAATPPQPPEWRRLSQELQVQQEELEIQNRQLIESQRLLEHSRDRLASLYYFAPVPYITFCNQGVIREINLTGAALLGLSRERLIDRPLVLFVQEPYRRVFLNHVMRCRKAVSPVSTELVLRAGDRRLIPVEIRTNPLRIDSGGQPQHLAIIIDLSDRQRLEQERERLREITRSEQLLRTVLETLPVAVRVVGEAGESLLFNEACREIWGIGSGAPLPALEQQKGWDVRTHREMTPSAWPVSQVLAGNEGILRQRIDIEGFDGARRMVIQSTVPLIDDAGAITGAIEVTEDVTRLLAAQDTARRRQEQLEAAFDAAHLSFWDWNLDTNRVTWSGPFEEYFREGAWNSGSRMEELFALIHSADVGSVRETLEAARAGGTVFESEFRVVGGDTSIRWLSAKGRFTYREDRPVRMTGVLTDITARKESEVELRRAKEAAEEASRVKDDFLATVSHELRTPLSAILLWAHIARSRLGAEGEMARAIETIQHSARAQSQIIEDLLDISRGIAGKLRLNLRTTALAPAVKAALEAVRPSAEAKQITLEAELDETLPPLQVDTDRIQQVAWNLLTNAIKFTRCGGTVRVKLFLHAQEGEAAVTRLIVSDTGQGIAPEFLPYLFERFRQAESGTTRSHGGLGLGMAISRELVQMHGGTIRAESAGLGHGATFIVDLPISAALIAGAAANPAPDEAESLRGRKVLVVEDEPSAREALGQLLQTAGAAVRTVDSAGAAIEAFERETPDVLISDIAMPGQDGYSMLRTIRGMESPQAAANGAGAAAVRTPAVALTARARAEDRAESMAAGFQAHLTKPVEPAELIATVANLCRPGASAGEGGTAETGMPRINENRGPQSERTRDA